MWQKDNFKSERLQPSELREGKGRKGGERSALVLVKFNVGLHPERSRANESHFLWQVGEWMMKSDSSNS